MTGFTHKGLLALTDKDLEGTEMMSNLLWSFNCEHHTPEWEAKSKLGLFLVSEPNEDDWGLWLNHDYIGTFKLPQHAMIAARDYLSATPVEQAKGESVDG